MTESLATAIGCIYSTEKKGKKGRKLLSGVWQIIFFFLSKFRVFPTIICLVVQVQWEGKEVKNPTEQMIFSLGVKQRFFWGIIPESDHQPAFKWSQTHCADWRPLCRVLLMLRHCLVRLGRSIQGAKLLSYIHKHFQWCR